MSMKVRRQNSHSPEPTFKEKGAGIVCVGQSHIFYSNIFKVRHNLRLNADVADTALQKSLRQFCKYCWQNLNYGRKKIIFI